MEAKFSKIPHQLAVFTINTQVVPNLIQMHNIYIYPLIAIVPVESNPLSVSRVLEKIESLRGFGLHWGFWIEKPSGICWFWMWRGVLIY